MTCPGHYFVGGTGGPLPPLFVFSTPSPVCAAPFPQPSLARPSQNTSPLLRQLLSTMSVWCLVAVVSGGSLFFILPSLEPPERAPLLTILTKPISPRSDCSPLCLPMFRYSFFHELPECISLLLLPSIISYDRFSELGFFVFLVSFLGHFLRVALHL